MKRLALLGSTGSIGIQTLEIVSAHQEEFEVEVLSSGRNSKLLIEQARKFHPNAVVIADEEEYASVRDGLADLPIKVFAGTSALEDVVQWDQIDIVLSAIVGFAGFQPLWSAVTAGKQIALANKEALVVAGAQVIEQAAKHKARIIPVDSEHSAIFQCLLGEEWSTIERIILTASGGPFIDRKTNFLVNVKASHALQHPTRTMGTKSSIDSATLMNKGMEMIEAKWLFGLENEQIDVVIHPQSIVQSVVEFIDGSVKAQLGLPDMKLPIQFALGFPKRLKSNFKRFRFRDFSKLTFDQPDYKTFRNLAIAQVVMEKGGNAGCVMNAANEVVVQAFLANKIGFLEMSEVIEKTLEQIAFHKNPTIEELEHDDKEARVYAEEMIKKGLRSIY